MALFVCKYGGTSLASAEHIQRMARRVVKARSLGHRIVVVVSAMAGETNRLIQLSKTFSPALSKVEYDALLSTGEQASSALFSMALNALYCPARSFTGMQAGIHTEDKEGFSTIADVTPDELLASLRRGEVPVVAGFQGADASGRLRTLGRGGSDATAVALAAALQADACYIYTDVSGVCAVDPNIAPEACPVPELHIDEMLAMAQAGAQVLQVYALTLAKQYRVPLHVLPHFSAEKGTQIVYENKALSRDFLGLACWCDQTAFVVSSITLQKVQVLNEKLTREGIDTHFWRHDPNKGTLTFALSTGQCWQAHSMIQALTEPGDAEVRELGKAPIAVFSVVSADDSVLNDAQDILINVLKNKQIDGFTQDISRFALSVLIEQNDLLCVIGQLCLAFDVQIGPVRLKN